MGLSHGTRGALIDALAGLRVMRDDRLVDVLHQALTDAPFGPAFIDSFELTGGPRDVARRLVVLGERAGDPRGHVLSLTLDALRAECTNDTECAALERAVAELAQPDVGGRTVDPLTRMRAAHVDAWTQKRDKRHQRFVRLILMPEAAAGEAPPRPFEALSALMDAVPEPAVLLVGPPGAGKSTLLRHLAYELAEADLGENNARIVFHLPLSEYPQREGLTLAAWFEERFERDLPGLGSLDAALRRGPEAPVWLLLDGLNEMAFGNTAQARFTALREALERWPQGHKALITCRTQDVTGSLGAVRRAEVQPLSAEAVRMFLDKYAPERAASAIADLERLELLELYQNPYRLSLLVNELQESGAIPPDRAALFSTMILRAMQRDLSFRSAQGALDTLINPAVHRYKTLPKPYTPAQTQGRWLLA